MIETHTLYIAHLYWGADSPVSRIISLWEEATGRFANSLDCNLCCLSYLFIFFLSRLYSVIADLPGYVCVEVLRPSQSNGVMSSAVSLPSHTFTGQA